MKPYLKPTPIRLILALLLAITVIIVHSCKKDRAEQVQKATTVTSTDPTVTAAQKWYDSAYAKKVTTSASKQAIQSVNKLSHDWSQKFMPYWAKANVFIQSGMTFIELPATQNGQMGVAFNPLKDTTNINFAKLGTLTDLLIVKQQSGFSMYAMTIVADSSYLKGNYSKVANNSYSKMDTNFTGAVLFHRMDGTFVNGWRYVNGQVTRQLSLAPAGSTVIQSAGKLQVDVASPCSTIEVTTYWEDCSYSEGTNYTVPYDCYIYTTVDDYEDCSGGGGGGGSSGGAPPPPPCQVPSPGSSSSSGSSSGTTSDAVKGKLIVDVTAPPTGGSGGTTPPPPPPPLQPCPTETVVTPTSTQTVINNLTDTCLRAVLNKLVNSNLNGEIANIINNVFGSTDKVNIDFEQNNDPNNSSPAQTIGPPPTNGTFNATVTLNLAQVGEGSQEYKAIIMIHEVLHAYLDYNSPGLSQLQEHQIIAQNYVNAIKTFAQELYPTLSDNDAYSIILNGIGDLYGNNINDPNYIALRNSYNVTDFSGTFLLEKSGVDGTPCSNN